MWSTAGPVGEKVLHMPAPWLGMWYHQRPAPLAGDEVLHSPGPPGWGCGTTNPSPLAGDEVLLPQPGGWKVNNSVKSVVKMCDTQQYHGDKNLVKGMPKQFSTSTEVQNIQNTSHPHYKIPGLKQKYQAISGSQNHLFC